VVTYSRQFIHQPTEWSKKKKAIHSRHYNLTGCAQTASYKKWIHVVFFQRVDQSDHEAVKTCSVVLRMSEISPDILRAKYLNG